MKTSPQSRKVAKKMVTERDSDSIAAPVLRQTSHPISLRLCAFAVIFSSTVILLLSGCGNDNGQIGDYRYRSDMFDQPSFRKHEAPLNPVAGTVPVGGIELPIPDSASSARLRNPVPPTAANADSGRVLYQTYCSPCHGLGGRGDGPVAAKFQVPPDITTGRFRTAPDGYIYYVIRNGKLIMPAYAEAVKRHERWLIVNHVRALQAR